MGFRSKIRDSLFYWFTTRKDWNNLKVIPRRLHDSDSHRPIFFFLN